MGIPMGIPIATQQSITTSAQAAHPEEDHRAAAAAAAAGEAGARPTRSFQAPAAASTTAT
jgi:hypothetical protein